MMCYIINLILTVFLLSGCSPVKKEAKKVSQKGADILELAKYKVLPKKRGPKKKVLIAPFLCAWNPLSNYGIKVSSKFAQRLKHEPGNILVYLPKNPSSWMPDGFVPRFGIIDDPDMVKDAASLNMNYLITGIIDVMKVERRTNGVWPFRHFDQVFEAILVINVIDTVTGALVESHMASERFAIPLKKLTKEENKLFRKVLNNTVPALIKKQVKLAAKVIENDTWKAKIVEIEENPGRIKINAGSRVGIKEGMLLEVHKWGKKLRSSNGNFFYCLGERLGIIKIVSVKKDYAFGVPLNKADYKAGLPVICVEE